MLQAGFEPTTSANERSETRALDRGVTGMGNCSYNSALQYLSLTLFLIRWHTKYPWVLQLPWDIPANGCQA